jgi:hypothetical protein
MADDQAHIPTATEVYDAVRKIRESKPGLGLKKVITILRDKHGWYIIPSRLRKLVAPGDDTNNKQGELLSIEMPFSFGRTHTECLVLANPKLVAPTLAGVLSNGDLCDRILGPLLTANATTIDVQNWTRNFQGFHLLWVSVDIRKRAWDFIQQKNIWVQAQFVWDAANVIMPLPSAILRASDGSEHTQPGLIQPNSTPDFFTPEMIKQFCSSVSVTISIGHLLNEAQPVGAKVKTIPIFFAFHPQQFDFFIRDLATTVEEWASIKVEVNHSHLHKVPCTIPVVVDNIVRGLGQIRGANRVTSISLLKDSIDPIVDFNKIAQTMMGPSEANTSIYTTLLDIYARGTASMDEGDYHGASDIFHKGCQAYNAFRREEIPKPKPGSVEYNAIEQARIDIESMSSESLNLEISVRRSISTDGCAGPRLMSREVEIYKLARAVPLASSALDSPCLTDNQRFYGHHRRAVAFANLGDFIIELHAVVPGSEHAAILGNTVLRRNEAVFCYRQAAHDAFYASHVAATAGLEVPWELVDATHALRRQVCDKIGYDADEHLAQMRRTGLARLQVPVLGLWEGDPELCAAWGPHNMMLLALFRQREGSCSGGPSIADIKAALARSGLRVVYNDYGQAFLEGNAGAHMRPAWVVPDDTREGLRAAGLSGGRFEMAWR